MALARRHVVRCHAMDGEDGNADQALMAAVATGDEGALRGLYERYGGLILTLALRLVGERETAEEIMQDVFVRCWQSASTYVPGRGSVAGWLMGMTRNRAIDHLRGAHAMRRDASLTVALEPSRNGHDPSSRPEAAIELLDVGNALAALAVEQRIAVALVLYGGLTQAEISEQLGVPLGTVKSRVRVGMQRLRERLGAAEARP